MNNSNDPYVAKITPTRAESALFTALNYGFTLPPEKLPRRAEMEDYNPNGPTATEEECRNALSDCLAKSWLRIIDDAALTQLAEELRKNKVLGPIYGGLPKVGCVDFSEEGAQLYHRLHPRNESEREFAYADVVQEKTAHFFRCHSAAITKIEEIRKWDEVTHIRGPIPIGPWRAQWWRRFDFGFRVDVEERRQWQGRAVGGGESHFIGRLPEDTDLSKLESILSRRHLTFAEWFVFEGLEHFPDYGWTGMFARSGANHERWSRRITISDDEWSSGLESCIDRGWVQKLDRSTVSEIRKQLMIDSAIVALPATAHFRSGGYSPVVLPKFPYKTLAIIPLPDSNLDTRFDFTTKGATLYRSLAAEWLGPEWEDRLHISQGYYWVEHHYSEMTGGFGEVIQKHVAGGNIIRRWRIEPIGAWCVDWWKRFPSGYRLELELESEYSLNWPTITDSQTTS